MLIGIIFTILKKELHENKIFGELSKSKIYINKILICI